jgi:transposase
VRRIDELFEIERTINSKTPEQQVAPRQDLSKPLFLALEAWLREQRDKLSSKSETRKAINYCLTRWTAFTRFLDDGGICLSNNAAERPVRGVVVGRKKYL